MCVDCGCSDNTEAKITNPETGEITPINLNGEHHHHHHTHTLSNGAIITHSHGHESEYFHSHTLPNDTVINHSHSHDIITEPSQIHAKVHGTTISLEQ
ncbi:MAG: hydrogenase accessory protein HypB, partial [Rhizonema sp. PD38]|nr:hydrogenase accessory protein HypB [Rhizonema sp. PD38]